MQQTFSESQISRDGSEKLLDGAGISVDRMPMLGVVFDRVATHATDNLQPLVATPAQLAVKEIGVGNISDILDSFESQVVYGVMYAAEWNTRILVALDRSFLFTLTETMFGGDGSEAPIETDRPYSSIEIRLAQVMFEQTANALQTAFALVAGTPFKFERIETRMDFTFLGKPTGMAVITEIGFEALNREGHMFIVIPQAVLNPVRQNLTKDITVTPKQDPRWTKQFEKEVGRAEITLRAIVDGQSMTLGDVTGLKVGQFLTLPGVQTPNRVILECNGRPLFYCQLGKADGFYTLRIEEFVDGEQQFINELMQ